jgi:transposase
MIGAIRVEKWVTVRTAWDAVNTDRFAAWVRRDLAPQLRAGDVVVLDNLWAHKRPLVRELIEARGARSGFCPLSRPI